MKKSSIKKVRIAAAVVFVLAFLLNIQTNLNGDTSLFGSRIIANGTGGGGTGGTGGGGTGGTGPGDESGNGYWEEENYFTQKCNGYSWTRIVYKGVTGSTLGTAYYVSGVLVEGSVMADGTYSTKTTTTGTAAESYRQGWSCPTASWSLCFSCPDPCGNPC